MSKPQGWMLGVGIFVLIGWFANNVPDHVTADRLFFWLVLGVGGGVGLFWFSFGLRNRCRMIENIPTSKIRSMAMGLVEVEGKAGAYRDVIKTPLSDQFSLFCEYKVEEKRGKHWYDVTAGKISKPFYVEDETGRALIDPGEAELHMSVDRKYTSYDFDKAKCQEFEAGLTRMGIKPRNMIGLKRMLKATETYILPGDHVYVMGSAMPNPAPLPDANGEDRILIRKGDDPHFYLSDQKESEFKKDLKMQYQACLFGGPVITVSCLLILLMRYFH